MKRLSDSLEYVNEEGQNLLVEKCKYEIEKEQMDSVIWAMLHLQVPSKATYEGNVPHIHFFETLADGTREHDFYSVNGRSFSKVTRIMSL